MQLRHVADLLRAVEEGAVRQVSEKMSCRRLRTASIGGIIAARLLDEERFLSKNMPSYEDYCRKVRYRLIPYLW